METYRTDSEFLAAFEAATLPRAEWTHAAHLRMAYLYLRKLSVDAAIPVIRAGIQRYNEANGNFTGYHETVTVAFCRIVAGHLSAEPAETFDEFMCTNPDLFTQGVAVLSPYYSYPVWKDPEARKRFIEPDRKPLP